MCKFNLNLGVCMMVMLALANSCSDAKKVQNGSSSANLTNEAPRLDPSKAKVQLVNPMPRLGNATELSTLQVPILDIGHVDADMVQIIRCVEGYVPRTPTGQEISTLNGGGGLQYDLQQIKWAWLETLNARNDCRLVGTNIARTTFEDLAAGDGRWYYLVNPCVSASRSTTGKEDCSYNVLRSGVIEYKNNLKPEFIKKSQELAEMEGLLSTHFGNLIYYSRQIRDKTRACEDRFAVDQAQKSFLQGIISIAAGVVGAVVGAYIGGPQGAIMGASLMLNVARGIMQKPPAFLQCPDVDNFIEEAKRTTSLLDVQVGRVVEIRTEMSKLEASYGNLDTSIGKQTGTGQATGPATGATTPGTAANPPATSETQPK